MTRHTPAAAALIAVVLLLTACTAAPGQTSPSPDDAQPSTVSVERRSLTSTVVLGGTVVPAPEYLVEASMSGRIEMNALPVPGTAVTEGQSVGSIDGEDVIVPATGTITDVLTAAGATVVARLPVAAVAYEGFGVLVDVPVADQYRLYEGGLSALVNVTGGPSGLECRLVTPRSALEAADDVSVLCLLPPDAAVASGLEAKVGLNTGSRTDVLELPLQAVSGRADQGEVSRVNPDGTHETVTVGLGITDGVYIEIVSGLELGDTVLSYPPGIG